MSFNENILQRIAKLARIKLSAHEKIKLKDELSHILIMIDKLCAINTNDVMPMTHMQATHLQGRPDIVTEINQREAFQAIAPKVAEGLYLVPKVIE